MENKKQIVPRCINCKKLYAVKDNDGSGLCAKCKPNNDLRGDQHMEELNKAEVQKEAAVVEGEINGGIIAHISETQQPNPTDVEAIDLKNDETENAVELKIEAIVQPGKFGVTNTQMIPAIKKAIEEKSVEKLKLLKSTYLYTFDNTLRYLKKTEREYLLINLK